MADLKRTIEILFEGKSTVGTAVSNVGKSLDKLNYSVSQVAQPFADITTSVAKVDAALAALAAGGIAYAFNESSKLQTATTELKKVIGDEVESLDAAKTAAKDLSNQYGESAASVLASTAIYKQAGFDINGSMTLAKDGMDLVIAGNLEASKASEILIASLKGFRAPAEDARRLIDILNEVSNNYATDIEQLGIGMAGISPIARTMGFSFEETAGIITPVIEIFRSGDEASRALKTGLLKLIDDSKPVSDALASIGVSQKDANGNLRSGKDILYDVAKAFQSLEEPQKLFITQQLVGIDQSARMVEVFNGLSKSTEITAVAMQAAGSAAKEVAERLKDPEVAVNRLKEGFSNLASSIGDEFQDAGVTAVDGFTSILNALEREVDGGAFDPILDALSDFLEGIGSDLESIAEALPEAFENVDFDGLLDSIGAIGDTIGGIFDGLDLGEPDDLAEAIQRVVDSLESLTRFSDEIASVFISLAKYIGGAIDTFNSLDKSTIETIAKITGIGAAITAISVPAAAATSAIKGLGSVLSLLGAGPVVAAVAGLGVAVSGIAIGTDKLMGKLYDWIHRNDEVSESSKKLAAEVDADIAKIRGGYDEASKATEGFGESAYDANLKTVNALDKSYGSAENLTEKMRELGILVEEKKTVVIDTAEAKKNLQELEYYRESTGTWETIKVPIDTTDVDNAKEDIEKAIPPVKRLKIETDLQIAKIKADADTAQAALKFRAEVDVAEIEAAGKLAVQVASNISSMFDTAGGTISSLANSLTDASGLSEKWDIRELLSDQGDYQKDLLQQQKKLTAAQVDYLNAKTDAMKKGEAMITVSGDGLQPHLEMIMWEIFEAIQVRATQEGIDQLLLGA